MARNNPVLLTGPTRGLDGRSVLAKARAPLITDGRIGDFWIDTVSKKLYGPKNAAEWPDNGLIKGDKGWTPVFATVIDGTRRVQQIVDWTGGEGTKPAVGQYVGADGMVDDIEDAVDFRGPGGPQALINALDAKTDAVTYETLTALAEDASDNEKAAIKRVFEAGGTMPFRSCAEGQGTSIPAAVKAAITQFYAPNYAVPSSLAGGAKYRRVNQEPTHGLKFRSLDRWTAEGGHDSANGGWWEIDEAAITPQMAGAQGDGVVDDTLAVNRWAAACEGREGRVPAGIYKLSAATGAACVTLPAGGITIKGDGRYKALFKVTGGSVPFAAVDADLVDISGCGFDGGATVRIPWQRALVLRGCRNVRIVDNWFRGLGDGAIMLGKTGFGGSDGIADATRQPERIQITGNVIEDCWGSVAIVSKYVGTRETIIANNIIKNSCSIGISIESEGADIDEFAELVTVLGNIVAGCSYLRTSGLSTVAAGISISEQARRVICLGNIVDGVVGSTIASGIEVGTSPTQSDTDATDIIISDNVVSGVDAGGAPANGIFVLCGDADVKSLVVATNVVSGTRYGITMRPSSQTSTLGTIYALAMTGNVVDGAHIGYFHDNTSSSGELPAEDATITGNIATNCASHGMQFAVRNGCISGNVSNKNGGIGIYIPNIGRNITVIGNVANDNGGDGIQGNGNRVTYDGNVTMNNGQSGGESYGIRHVTGTNCMIVNNRCGDDQGSPTQDYGVRAPAGSTVRNNDLVGNSTGSVWGGIGIHNTGTYDAGLNRTA